ncbi:hypothetical protein [Acetivibrio straminisolvens]|nr:hypothetical protein [Acetivibrio straminisolvens]
MKISLEHLFIYGEVGVWKTVGASIRGEEEIGFQLLKNEDGVIMVEQ